MSPGRMTNFIKGRDFPSQKTIEKICLNLKLNQQDIEQLHSIIEEEKYLRRGNSFSKKLTPEEFRHVSDWKTWSILSFFQSCDFHPSSKSISQKLNLAVADVDSSLKKLEHVGLIKKNGDHFDLVARNVTTTTDVPSADIRKVHKEFIQLAVESIDSVPVHERDITCMTMCIDKSKMPEIKKFIAEFRAKFNTIVETPEASELYHLNIQLFPIKGSEKDI